ncbi:hypothetical protein KVR01_008303 [Diaporthe batatas]|uniref:uncharacterized protein n=1 Tax=Diaporthe batatas TaxID=748121 RepID=UPI001D05B6F0|nr:uncharacterized protein KVR01_008303 [Diaporthe batatas]KAG8162538.1 hypothetical protein KVR01_008303 [Diaporthe batatas]
MCKFTYLGYDRCDEPERHYLIRREKCGAKANLKNWCSPDEQEEASTADQSGKFWVSLPCPMCADIPVVYDQPLLEIAHSRRSVLPAPHYDAVTGKYSRLPRHRQTAQDDAPSDAIPPPLKTTRMRVQRAATESTVTKSRGESAGGDYTLPATTYVPPTREQNLPRPFPAPQPATLTPPSSRDSSRSPPQIHMDGALRTTPPGEGSRRELDSIREKARAANAAAMEGRPPTAERLRSGSASSASSNGTSRPSQPSRQASNTSLTSTSSYASRAVVKTDRRPQRQPSASRSPPQDRMADTLANVALRSIGIDRNGSRSAAAPETPERGRRMRRRPTGGSGSDRSESPSVWRPTISPPVLQKDSLGMSQIDQTMEPFKQRLIPFPPNKGAATPNAVSIAKGQGLVESPARPKTPHPHATTNKAPVLRLFPNDADDEEIAAAAFERMFAAESKAQAYQLQVQAQAQAQAHADANAQVEIQMQARAAAATAAAAPSSSSGATNTKKDKSLPSVPAALRRVKTGQVKTVTVAPPRAPRRQNTSDSASSAGGSSARSSPPQPPASATIMKVSMGPTFSLAGVTGKEQEFEIVTGPDGTMLQEPALGRAF